MSDYVILRIPPAALGELQEPGEIVKSTSPLFLPNDYWAHESINLTHPTRRSKIYMRQGAFHVSLIFRYCLKWWIGAQSAAKGNASVGTQGQHPIPIIANYHISQIRKQRSTNPLLNYYTCLYNIIQPLCTNDQGCTKCSSCAVGATPPTITSSP